METLEELVSNETAEVKPCTIRILPKELWASAAETAIKINPANAPAVHQLKITRFTAPGGTILQDGLAGLTYQEVLVSRVAK